MISLNFIHYINLARDTFHQETKFDPTPHNYLLINNDISFDLSSSQISTG